MVQAQALVVTRNLKLGDNPLMNQHPVKINHDNHVKCCRCRVYLMLQYSLIAFQYNLSITLDKYWQTQEDKSPLQTPATSPLKSLHEGTMLQDNRVVKSYFRQLHHNSWGINTPRHRLSELCSREIMGAYYHTNL